MKRVFEEISDDEWENHSFKPSRVFNNKPQIDRPPSIESFAFKSSSSSSKQQPVVVVSDEEESSDFDCIEIKNETNLEDDDFDEVDVDQLRPTVNRGRRFVVDDGEDESEENSDGEFADVFEVGDEEDEKVVEDDDVVVKALQKCGKISAELKRDLYGSNVAAEACDRYAEVESSVVRIVTQVGWCFCIIVFLLILSV